MKATENITLREVESSDLDTLYAQQLDPEAIRLAAFVCEDPKDRLAFDAHWEKILKSPQITKRTIVTGGRVAGHISCYPQGEHLEVTYWLGREFWGRGIATQALHRMLQLVADRPILARAATDNLGSIRVLQKCGFKIIGKNKDFANGREKTRISPTAEAQTRKNIFSAWIAINQMNELAQSPRSRARRAPIPPGRSRRGYGGWE